MLYIEYSMAKQTVPKKSTQESKVDKKEVESVPVVVATKEVKEKDSQPKTPRVKKDKVVTEAKVDEVKVEKVASGSASSSAAVANVVVEASAETQEEPQISETFVEIQAKIQQLNVLANSIKTDLRQLEKRCSKEIKAAQKSSNKRRRKSTNRAPSGFVKPTRISDELAGFLGVPVGTELARTAVTTEIDKYVKLNSLQDKENGRKIIADAKLLSLLKISPTVELTYFNLQKYMRPHFQKSVSAVASADGVAVATA